MSNLPSYVREHDAIAKTVQHNIDGARSGKGDDMKPAFHKDATIFGYSGADLFAGPIQNLFDWNDENGPATELEARIASIDLTDTVASVRRERDNWTSSRFTDLFTLLKVDGEWKITNNVLHLHSRRRIAHDGTWAGSSGRERSRHDHREYRDMALVWRRPLGQCLCQDTHLRHSLPGPAGRDRGGKIMRFAVDTGGTFTDLIVEDDDKRLHMYKAPTTPHEPAKGLLAAIAAAAEDMGLDKTELLARGELLIHGTTISTNAVLTGNTARTAFLTTRGHPDILVFREGGRMGISTFDYSVPYPEPYVPRALSFEVPERIGADGEMVEALDEDAVIEIIGRLADKEVEAVGVCLLWSIVNPTHEQRVGALLDAHLPGVPYSLSHVVNPSLREYRRASAACIDASLKPLMSEYLASLAGRLKDDGFAGRLLVVTSQGGVIDAAELARTPIHSIKSGPAMAPIAGGRYAMADADKETAIIADTGGTSYDVSVVRRGRIPWTRETWIGKPFLGHMTGFPSVDVRSIGAGGGSVARVDEGGLLHVGPESAGSVPGPACYAQGGAKPTVTDAALVLGYIDPDYFLGGRMKLDLEAASSALETGVGQPLGFDRQGSAAAVMSVATENMVGAIEEITINQGIDPRTAVLVGGGGAAGLNSVAIARRLGCANVIIPDVGAALSAAGAIMSELGTDFAALHVTSDARFDFDAVNAVLADLDAQCRAFIDGPGAGSLDQSVEFSVEARYAHQIWEIEVPLRVSRFATDADVALLKEDFHATHREIFAIDDPESEIELIGWRARVRCRLRESGVGSVVEDREVQPIDGARRVYFADHGVVDARVLNLVTMDRDVDVEGPAIIESPFTTVVIDPGSAVRRVDTGSLIIATRL